jgi:hypothetical protein
MELKGLTEIKMFGIKHAFIGKYVLVIESDAL